MQRKQSELCVGQEGEAPGSNSKPVRGQEFWRQFESRGNTAKEVTSQNYTFAKLQQFYEGNSSFMQLWPLSNDASLNPQVPTIRTGFGCPGFFRLYPTGDMHRQWLNKKAFLKPGVALQHNSWCNWKEEARKHGKARMLVRFYKVI